MVELTKSPEPQLSTEAHLRQVTQAAQDVLTGVGVHNRSAPPGQHMQGPVLSKLADRVAAARQHLSNAPASAASTAPAEQPAAPRGRYNPYPRLIKADGVVFPWYQWVAGACAATVLGGVTFTNFWLFLFAALLRRPPVAFEPGVTSLVVAVALGVLLGEYGYECDLEVNGGQGLPWPEEEEEAE